MKNTKSVQQLILITAEIFKEEKYAKVSTVYASEDGFVFIEENRAKVHVKDKEGLLYHPITRTEALGTENIQGEENAEEMEDLKAKYQDLFGKAAHHNIGAEKLKSAIAEKEAELKDQNPQ